MKYSGQISKMKVELNNPITYHLPIGEHLINMNELLGENITLEFEGEIRCVACNNQIKKTFMQGYCYPCLSPCKNCLSEHEWGCLDCVEYFVFSGGSQTGH